MSFPGASQEAKTCWHLGFSLRNFETMLSWGFKAPVCEVGPGKLIQRDKEANGQIWEAGINEVPG